MNPIKQARLDFFLVSENLLPSITCSKIEPSYKSDHSFPKIVFKINHFKKGKGLWKFNNSLLHEREFLDMIQKTIVNVKSQYCLPVYDLNSIENIPNSEIQFSINDQLFLETLLIEIRGKTISYASFRKRQSNLTEHNLKKSIQDLEDNDNVDLNTLENMKKELESLRMQKIKGSIIRSKAKWMEEGEKPSNYFFNLENIDILPQKLFPK